MENGSKCVFLIIFLQTNIAREFIKSSKLVAHPTKNLKINIILTLSFPFAKR